MAGARRAVTQPNPPRSRSSCTRALVIIPLSPTITMSLSLNVSLTVCTMAVNAVGSAVFPGNTRTATGRPAGSVSSPYSICGRPFLPARGVRGGRYRRRAGRLHGYGRGEIRRYEGSLDEDGRDVVGDQVPVACAR